MYGDSLKKQKKTKKNTKLAIELLYESVTPFLSIYPKKTIIQNSTCKSMFIATLFIIARTDVNVH